jgi:hypothetical protein
VDRSDPSAIIQPMSSRTLGHRTSGRTGPDGPSRRPTPIQDERSLLDAIADGDLDAHLGALALAIDARRHLLHTIDSSHVLAAFCVGDRVRINQRISPRYLAGLVATVIEIDDSAATLRLDHPIGRFSDGRVRCPPLALESLNPKDAASAAQGTSRSPGRS